MQTIVRGIDRQEGGWTRFITEVVRLSPGAAAAIREGLREADEQDRLFTAVADLFGFGQGKSAELRLAEWRHQFVKDLNAASRFVQTPAEEAADYGDADIFRLVEYVLDDVRQWEAAYRKARQQDQGLRVIPPSR